MPFTLAHPAGAIPFTRCGLPLSALVVGSMAPDFPYFIHLSTSYQYGHTLPGLFWFCLPAGLIMMWLFHSLLKWPLLSLLPKNHQARLVGASYFCFGPARQFLFIAIALLLGACTHVVWDSFTHAGGWSVEKLAVLRAPVLQTARGDLPVFKILQHGSTFLGATALSVCYLQWLRQAPAHTFESKVQFSRTAKSRFIVFIFGFAVFCAAIYSYLTSAPTFEIQAFMRKLVVMSVGMIGLEILIFSVLWHMKAARNRLDS